MKHYAIEEVYTSICANYKPFEGNIRGLCHIEEMLLIDGGIAPCLATDVYLGKITVDEAFILLTNWAHERGHKMIDIRNNLIRRYLIGNDLCSVRLWCADIMQDFVLALISDPKEQYDYTLDGITRWERGSQNTSL